MEWAPTERAVADVEKVAFPVAFRVPVPSAVDPSLKVTVPVAVLPPAVLGETVAVKVTDWPNTEGLAPEVTVVVVVAATVKVAVVVWVPSVASTVWAPGVAAAGTVNE